MADCIVLPPADPRGVIDHRLPGVARGINHRARWLALANLSSASEALNLSTGQRAARSGAKRSARRILLPCVRLCFTHRLKTECEESRIDARRGIRSAF